MNSHILGLMVSTFAGGTTAPVTKPDIIVVLVDDMGYSDFGCYGGEARTPNIDTLAENGIRFRNFYNTARCSPTRASILTGNYSHQVADDPAKNLPTLRTDNNITMAEFLRMQGYRTYMAGKWHLGFSQQSPANRGFQHIFGFGAGAAGAVANYWDQSQHTLVSENNEIPSRTYGSGPSDFYQTDVLADYSIDFINHHISKNDHAPFFLYLPIHAPHSDIAAPKNTIDSYVDTYRRGWNEIRSERFDRMKQLGAVDERFSLPPFNDTSLNQGQVWPVPDWDSLPLERQEDLARRMAVYTAMIDRIDVAIGRITEHLRDTGRLDNTLIFILSDNGCSSEGGLYGSSSWGREPLTGEQLENMGQPDANDKLYLGGGWANVSNTPFRYYKRYSHEGGICTSMIVHWPTGINTPGRWSDQKGHIIDIMSTIAEITGTPVPAEYNHHTVLPPEGISLTPVFRNEQEINRQIGFEHEGNRAWIDGRWKLVTKNFSDDRNPADELELYDLQNDPLEQINLTDTEPEQLITMARNWNLWARRVGVPENLQLIIPGAELPPPEPPPVPEGTVVDKIESGDGWILVGGVGRYDAQSGLTPVNGTGYFNFNISPGDETPHNNRAIVKNLGLTLEAGRTYTVTVSLGCFVSGTARPFIADAFTNATSDQIAIGFFDPTGLNLGTNSNATRKQVRDRINAVLTAMNITWNSRTVPSIGNWEVWSYSFTVPAGSPYAGKTLYFGIYGGHTGESIQKSMAADNLHIFVE